MCTCVPPWASRSSSVNGYLFTHPADTVFKGTHGIGLRIREATEACRFQFFSEGLVDAGLQSIVRDTAAGRRATICVGVQGPEVWMVPRRAD